MNEMNANKGTTMTQTTFGYKVAFTMKLVGLACLLTGQVQAAVAIGGAGLLLGWLESPKVETV
jgi:hypothetical protein